MNVKEFYEKLSQVDSPRMLRLAPGPLSLRVGEADALAAKLLLWLEEQMPDDATFGDLDDVLDAAKWWTTFFVSMIAPGEADVSPPLLGEDNTEHAS